MLRSARLVFVRFSLTLVIGLGCGGGGGGGAGPAGATGGASGASGSGGMGSGGSNAGTGGGGTGGASGSGGAGTGGAGSGGMSGADGSVAANDGARDAPAGEASETGLSFFVTSTGSGTMGGNLGGLAGADAKCQALAAVVGAGNRTWHAYLSLSGPTPMNARDRIGNGPWYNAKGVKIAQNLAQLHEEGGGMNALSGLTALDENGLTVPTTVPNEHDVFTGTAANGMALPATPDLTCAGWTAATGGAAQCGHCNRMGNSGNPPTSWNSAHATPGCSQADVKNVGGSGRFYCFAI